MPTALATISILEAGLF